MAAGFGMIAGLLTEIKQKLDILIDIAHQNCD
jgi:hypothetical protein